MGGAVVAMLISFLSSLVLEPRFDFCFRSLERLGLGDARGMSPNFA